jgi:hypothetical protein
MGTKQPNTNVTLLHDCQTLKHSKSPKRPVHESWIASVVSAMSQIMCRKTDWMRFIFIF